MKEIRTIRMVEQTEVKFIADDGKEFIGENAERDCMIYERRKNEEKVINEFRKLKPKWIMQPVIDCFYGDIGEVISVTVNDEVDYDITIKDYFYIKSPYMEFCGYEESKPTEFPANIIIVSGGEWVDVYGTVEEFKEELLKAVAQLG